MGPDSPTVTLVGRRTTSPEFAGQGWLVVTNQSVAVSRYYGGGAAEVGNLFLMNPRTLFTPEEAKFYLGTSANDANTLDYRVNVIIPAGTVLKVGLAKPNAIDQQAGPFFNKYLGGGVVVQLADRSDLKTTIWSDPVWLPSDGGDPWGDGRAGP
jgi:hypothetical protein